MVGAVPGWWRPRSRGMSMRSFGCGLCHASRPYCGARAGAGNGVGKVWTVVRLGHGSRRLSRTLQCTLRAKVLVCSSFGRKICGGAHNTEGRLSRGWQWRLRWGHCCIRGRVFGRVHGFKRVCTVANRADVIGLRNECFCQANTHVRDRLILK